MPDIIFKFSFKALLQIQKLSSEWPNREQTACLRELQKEMEYNKGYFRRNGHFFL
uniref:Uncharacterized protein n=1 Tax=Rhizophora mucronata TaxID=61149 RepID=A0A2P2NSE9_RHIMU